MSTEAPPAVLFLDLSPDAAGLTSALHEAAARVISGGRYVLGPELERFEEAFAARCGAARCVGVACGLDALQLALQALGVAPGDEVIVPSHTYIATWLAVSRIGARPVPVEPDPATGCIDPGRLEAACTPRTRALVPVHMCGHPAPMADIVAVARARGLAVVEDCAQAHGATCDGRPVGGWGDAGAWSFYPGKNLGALGDAGAVTTDDPAVARRLRRLRNYGSERRYVHEERGANSRLDELQAALLSVKLGHLDAALARRRDVAAAYDRGLAGLPLRTPARPPGHAWHLYAVRTPRRDELLAHLGRCGVEALIHYPVPPHLQGAYADLGMRPGDLPIAEAIAAQTLSLPMGPHLEPGQVDRVVDCVRGFFDS